jgi:nucleotide-binding universal stress UspA family protein
MARNIAIGFDGSTGSRRAFEEAVRLALLDKASLYVITIEELPRYPGTVGEVIEEQETAKKHIEALHKEAIDIAKKHGLEIKTKTRIGHPAKGLVDYVQETKPDLLILGHTGQSAIWGSFLGTTADKVIRHAICSVLVVR